MNTTKEMYIRQMGIDEKVYDYSQTLLENLKERFAKIDETAEYNQMKVVAAMQKNHVAEMHLNGTTGYGYNDDGRDTLEQVYADVFHTEAALVRPQIMCGTHALNIALSANLNCFHLSASHMIPWMKLSVSVLQRAVLPNMGLLTARWICCQTAILTMRVLKMQLMNVQSLSQSSVPKAMPAVRHFPLQESES